MRRALLLTVTVSLLLVAAARAEYNHTLLGSAGEVYTVQQGSYAALFGPQAPAGAGAFPVLALDVQRDGHLERLLVPGTDGPENEQLPAIAFDAAGGRVYTLWLQGGVFHLAGYAADGWQPTVELAGDPASSKSNPQLTVSTVTYQRLDAEGVEVAAKRTVLHLVWFDDGAAGKRLLYTAVTIEGDAVTPGEQVFDLRLLAGDAPSLSNAGAVSLALLQRPVARRGHDTENVGLAFVDSERDELVTLELRPIDGDLLCFADEARAVIIDFGRQNPGLGPAALADLARAVIIDFGRHVLHPLVADFLSTGFLQDLAAGDAEADLHTVVNGAWAQLLGTGITLQQGSSSGTPHIVELAAADADGTSRALDLRWVSRRALPSLPDNDMRLFLSPRAQEASIAWSVPDAVHYRETNPAGWEPLRSIAVGPTLSPDQAMSLVEQHLEDQ